MCSNWNYHPYGNWNLIDSFEIHRRVWLINTKMKETSGYFRNFGNISVVFKLSLEI
ncbi:hypothetical protein HanRHA438_Chr17g0821201 [Helianthus annuus]|nr:hypothetical protein HanRHA438_Chr17g0821201 [Helianthus annuus]